MASDGSAAGLIGLMLANGAVYRAAHYRREAEKYRRLARLEDNERVRSHLLDLAAQYDELSTTLDPQQH